MRIMYRARRARLKGFDLPLKSNVVSFDTGIAARWTRSPRPGGLSSSIVTSKPFAFNTSRFSIATISSPAVNCNARGLPSARVCAFVLTTTPT
jgi:hypothetical protein